MRQPHRTFKAPPPRADHGSMAPGGTRSGRRAGPFALALLTVALLAPLLRPPTALGASTRSADGDAGTGMPTLTRPAPTLSASTYRWADVTSAHRWARRAIDHVAGTKNWMRDFRPQADGTLVFRPDVLARRKHVARALVRAFAPNATPDPRVSFSDLDDSAAFWPYAAVAVSKGWLTTGRNDTFRPNDPLTMTQLHRAIVIARGLRPALRGLSAIHTADGRRIQVPPAFAPNVLGMRLELRYPSKYQDHDVHPRTRMTRIQVAYSLWKATAVFDRGTIAYLNAQYDEVELPRMRESRREIVEWGARFAGFPYVWGGEWGLSSPSPLGGQTIPGFDCSGWTWWVMRRNDGAWTVAPPRPYRGWALPQRTSATMAGATRNRLKFDELKPGDLMFYDGSGDGVVDHVDVYAGRGWALDSSNTPAGVTLMWVGTGWYRDHFKFGRRIT